MGGTGDIGGGSCKLNFKVWKKGGNANQPSDKWDCHDLDGEGSITFDFPAEATGTIPGRVTVPLRNGVKVKINWP